MFSLKRLINNPSGTLPWQYILQLCKISSDKPDETEASLLYDICEELVSTFMRAKTGSKHTENLNRNPVFFAKLQNVPG